MTFQLLIWIAAITILFIISNSIAHAAGAREAESAKSLAYQQGYTDGLYKRIMEGAEPYED